MKSLRDEIRRRRVDGETEALYKRKASKNKKMKKIAETFKKHLLFSKRYVIMYLVPMRIGA